jgi:hypothetical protein
MSTSEPTSVCMDAPTPYALAVSRVPAVHFNGPRAPRAWREQMLREGVSKPTRQHAWRANRGRSTARGIHVGG